MRKSLILLAATSFTAIYASTAFAAESTPPAPQDSAEDSSSGMGDIIVTARREAENLQKVPVAVSVIDSSVISSQGTFRPENISASVPSVNQSISGDTDRGNLIFTLRGQSFTYGALFPSVITYFAEVPTQYLSVGQFYDLDSFQVLRGPQGVQFGRVTNGGNIMVAPKRPTDDLSADITIKAGTYNLLGTTGFANVPISETLSARFSWDVAKRDGFTKNIFSGKRLDDLNYKGGRFGLLWKPSDRFENYIVGQVQYTDDNGTSTFGEAQNYAAAKAQVSGLFGFGGLVTAAADLGMLSPVYGINPITGQVGAFNGTNSIPLTADNYVAAIKKTLDEQKLLGKRKVNATSPTFNRRKFVYVVNNTRIDLSDELTLNNIVGYTRYIERSAQNYSANNSGLVQPCHSACPFQPGQSKPFANFQQLSEELRLSGKVMDGRLNFSIGGYMDEQKPAGLRENDTIFGGILEYLLVQRAKTKSRAVYGYAEFDVTDQFKVNGGIRYTHDTVDSRNANYNALLPVPGLQNMLFTNLQIYRDLFGVPTFQGLPDSVLQQIAAGGANSAALVNHGKCEDYNFGLFSNVCTRTKGKFNSTTWSFGASYQFTPRQLVYAKYSKGYRPGGVNATFPAGFENLRAFSPENNFSFEAGLKSDWSFGSVPMRTNIAVFKDRYKKIQQSIQIRDTNGNPGSIVTNVAAAGIWGIEFEGEVRPFEGFTLGANYSYIHSDFKSGGQKLADVNTPGTVTYDACNASAPVNLGFCTFNRFLATPKHQLGVNAHWDFIRDEGGIGTVGIGGNWYYQSNSAISGSTNSFLAPNGNEKSYSTLNLNANWNGMLGSRLDLSLFLTNVTNEIHAIARNTNTQLSSIGNQTAVYAPPRMFGGSLTAHF